MNEPITDRPEREVVLLADEDALTITRSRYGPGERGPDPHVHREHTDSFYVLEGELRFGVGPDVEPVRVAAGGFVAAPPDVVHTFVNDTGADAHFLNFHAPDAGFAAFMRGMRDGEQVAWDSFDPPADGGRPASDAIVVGAGEGERLVTGSRVVFLKAVLPELCVAERELDGPFTGPTVDCHDGQVDAFYELGSGRVLNVRAPEGGFADALRRMSS